MRRKIMNKLIYAFSVFALLVTACAPAAEPTEAPAAEPTEAPAAEPTEAVEEGIQEITREETVVIGWWGGGEFADWTLYNPFVLGFNYQTGPHVVWEGLAYWSAFTDETTMWQAESFSYNDDNTELTINLRPEVKWSDGVPFTAHDVVYTIETLKELDGEVRFSGEVSSFTKSVEALDDHTVLITMNNPAPRYFFRFFVWKWDSGAFPIVPKHIYEGQDWSEFENFDIEKGWPVTTAAFGVVFSNAEQKLYDAREDWWAYDAGLHEGLPMKRVAFINASADETIKAQLLVNGEIDITEIKPATAIDVIERTEDVTFHYGRRAPWGYTDWWAQGLHPNTTLAPLDNKDVRWALSYYTNREQIIEVAWLGASAPSRMPFPPYSGLLKYIDSIEDLLEEYNTIEYNPEKGDARLETAGYTKNADGMWVDASGEELVIIFSSWDFWNQTAEVLIEQWRQNGITVDYQTPPDIWDSFSAGNFEGLFPAGHAGSLKDPYEAMALYSCTRIDAEGIQLFATNFTSWCNEDFDKIVLQMSQTDPAVQQEEMFALFREAMEIWLPELPAIMMFDWPHNHAMSTKYWQGWPTSDGEFGEYVNEAPQLLGFDLVLWHLYPAGE